MSRSYSTFGELQPFTDGWKEASHSAMAPSDHVHRPFMLETEGKQVPIIRYASGSNGETYVMKAEIVEHSIVPAPDFVPKYGYRWQPREEFRDFGDENRHHYEYPDQLLQEFIYKIQDEACRRPTAPVAPPPINPWRSGPNPIVQENNRKYDDETNFRRDDRKKLNDSPNWDRYNEPYLKKEGTYARPTAPAAPPMINAWRSGPNRIVQENNRKYDEERNFRRDDPKKVNDSPNWDRHNEPYLKNEGTNAHPMIGKDRDVRDQFYERPRGNEGPNARSHPLSRPTNEINTATEFLKESIKPIYGNRKEKEKEKESNPSAYTEASSPPKTFPLPVTGRRTITNMSGPDTKVKPKDYDSEEEEEESRNPLGKFNGLKIANNRGEKPFEKKDRYESPKRNPGAMQFGQTAAGKKKTPETIDSREASRRYGKLPSRGMEGEEYDGTITSKEAMAKYNGALVP